MPEISHEDDVSSDLEVSVKSVIHSFNLVQT